MFKISIIERIKALVINFILGIGFGTISTFPLVSLGLMPDDSTAILPIALIGSIIAILNLLIRSFNKLEIQDNVLIVTSLFKNKTSYTLKEGCISCSLGGISAYNAPLYTNLKLKIYKDNKKSTHRFVGYNDKTLTEILSQLDPYLD